MPAEPDEISVFWVNLGLLMSGAIISQCSAVLGALLSPLANIYLLYIYIYGAYFNM